MQARVWLLDGTDAKGTLAMHVCDEEGCPRPPYTRTMPHTPHEKLLCEFHHMRKPEQDGQDEEGHEQDEDSGAGSTQKKAVYWGSARMGGVNGLFSPCGHVLGLSPQYGEKMWWHWPCCLLFKYQSMLLAMMGMKLGLLIG